MTNLKKARLNKGISQKELALTMKVAQPTVSAWENGKKNPTKENLKVLCEILNTTADYLLGISNDKKDTGKVSDYEKNEAYLKLKNESKNLTQEEIETLTILAKRLKEQREKMELE